MLMRAGWGRFHPPLPCPPYVTSRPHSDFTDYNSIKVERTGIFFVISRLLVFQGAVISSYALRSWSGCTWCLVGKGRADEPPASLRSGPAPSAVNREVSGQLQGGSRELPPLGFQASYQLIIVFRLPSCLEAGR